MTYLNLLHLARAGLLLSMMAWLSPAVAQTQAAVTDANKKKIEAVFTAWRAGTGGLVNLLAEDCRWTIVGNSQVAGTYVGKQHIIDDVLAPFGARFVKSSDRFKPIAIKGFYADRDEVVIWWDGAGTSNDGKPYTNNYAWFLTMHDGMVTDATAFFDSIAFNDLWTRVPASD